MKLLRKILFPVSIIYWVVTYIRNLCFDTGVFKSKSYPIPVIAIGNLSVGGTGKTPQTEYLIDLLSKKYNLALLSRGYKRKTKGYLLAEKGVLAEDLGDESYQVFQKFPEIKVVVSESRQLGIENLMKQTETNLVLLDDAFQHRKVKAGFYIVLTAFDDLFCEDYILPFGNLREPSLGKKRAHVVVVTKCPTNLSETQKMATLKKLQLPKHIKVFFSSINYASEAISETGIINLKDIKEENKIIVAGIAKPQYFVEKVKSNLNDEILIYPDHYNFTDNEVEILRQKAVTQKIITTEKDYVRLANKNIKNLFYLPIKTSFLFEEGKLFDAEIYTYLDNTV